MSIHDMRTRNVKADKVTLNVRDEGSGERPPTGLVTERTTSSHPVKVGNREIEWRTQTGAGFVLALDA
jgi:hypothetical protein